MGRQTLWLSPNIIMDVLEKLKIYMGYIVNCIFINSGNDEELFLNEMYKMIENDIEINFDSERFYLLEFKSIEFNNIYFNIDNFNTPLDLLVMIRDLIRHERMDENIKNHKYLIHFRKFKDNVFLEDKADSLRIEAYLQMHGFLRNPIKIRIYLINKRVEIANKIKKMEDEDEIIQLKIQDYRIQNVLKAIEMRTIQTY